MKYLERFLDSGINGIEPCEPPPQGDVVLKGAKQRVGDRMLLCGNIPSQNFRFTDLDHTEELVKQAIRDGAPGGGFILRTTGGSAGTWMVPELDLDRQLAHCQRLIEAGLKYGKYPINI
jgi:uroporphyrinogen-III decarboxylase